MNTPGPWKVGSIQEDFNAIGQPLGKGIQINYAGPDHAWHIATAYGTFSEPTTKQGTAQENANLIAAAPDLLEALKNLYQHPVHMKDCAFLKSGVNACDCAKGKAVAQAYEVLTKLGV